MSQRCLGSVAVIILIALGVHYLFKKTTLPNLNSTLNTSTLFASFSKGFLINFVNPFVFLVWISLITYARTKFHHSGNFIIFFSAILTGIFTIDVLKTMLANKVRSFLTVKNIRITHRLTGIILLAFALRTAWYVYNMS